MLIQLLNPALRHDIQVKEESVEVTRSSLLHLLKTEGPSSHNDPQAYLSTRTTVQLHPDNVTSTNHALRQSMLAMQQDPTIRSRAQEVLCTQVLPFIANDHEAKIMIAGIMNDPRKLPLLLVHALEDPQQLVTRIVVEAKQLRFRKALQNKSREIQLAGNKQV